MSLSEEVVQIPVTSLRAFPNHPFYVQDDDMMQQLVESIRQVGVLMPIIVRRSEDDFYEIISGHRRKHACELLEHKTVPAIIKELEPGSPNEQSCEVFSQQLHTAENAGHYFPAA